MSLIFDRFPSKERAKAFQRDVAKKFPQHRTQLWDSHDEMEALFVRQLNGTATEDELNVEADVFPCKLDPPIVLVSRLDNCAHERAIERLVEKFGGNFAGT